MDVDLTPDMVEVAALLVAAAKPTRTDPAVDRFLPVMEALVTAGRRGMTQVQLASVLSINPATMSRLVDSLVRRGLLARLDHPLDRRCKVIQLTDQGRERLAKCANFRQSRCDRMFQGLGDQDLTTLKSLLRQVVRNLSST